MSQSNAGTVRRYYDLVDEDAVGALVDLFAPDVVYERPGQDRIEGREELERFYREGRPLSAGTHEVHRVIEGREAVATRGTFTGEQDGEAVELGFADVFTFDEEGRIATRFTYTDRDTV
ncbi:MAG: nuclear transport factor 2 family protein [Halanaeroarchaeum sp.]